MMRPGKSKVNIKVLSQKEKFQLRLQSRFELLSEGEEDLRRWLVKSQTL